MAFDVYRRRYLGAKALMVRKSLTMGTTPFNLPTMSVSIRFTPHLRRGTAGALDDTGDDATHAAVTVTASFVATTQAGDSTTTLSPEAVPMRLRVLGAGEVTGLSPGAITRRWPREGSGDAEPNLFPLVEFLEADLPWRYTPSPPTVVGAGSGIERLSPWLVLLAIKTRGPTGSAESEFLSASKGRRKGSIERVTITGGTVLPNLDDAWAWAHVQWTPAPELCSAELWATGRDAANGRERIAIILDGISTAESALLAWLLRNSTRGALVGAPPDGTTVPTGIPDDIAAPFSELGTVVPARVASAMRLAVLQYTLRSNPSLVRSRLVCPRNLEPNCSYQAVLVPRFRRGVLRGLGRASELDAVAALELAWSGGSSGGGVALAADLELPVYDSWTFSTGAVGDFEALVQKLAARNADELAGVGTVDVRLATSVPDDGHGDQVGMWGALRPVTSAPVLHPPLGGVPFRAATGVDAPDTAEGDPVVKPPLYGSKHLQRTKLSESGAPRWFEDLNIDPRWRAAAGLGAELVRRDQAALLNEAWDQYETDLRAENARRRRALVANRLNTRMLDRHLPPDAIDATDTARSRAFTGRALGLFVPATGKMREFPPETPRSAFDPVLLRIQRGGGGIAKKLGLRGVTGTAASLVARIGTSSASWNQAVPKVLRGERSAVPTPRLGAGLDPGVDLPLPVHRVGVRMPVSPTDLQDAIRGDFGALLGKPGMSGALRALRAALTVAPAPPEALAAPQFLDPTLSERLAALSPTWILPGIDTIPDNSVVLVEQNPPFIESVLVGACVEMARELLMHEFPTDQRGTYFRFWRPVGDSGELVPRITGWTGGLGSNLRGTGGVVLLLKGELLRRYPNPQVYAARAGARQVSAEGLPTHHSFPVETDTSAFQFPTFGGFIEPDIGYYAFDLTAAEARAGDGWFFVFEERAGAPRFGLDESPATNADAPGVAASGAVVWDSLTWGDFAKEPGVVGQPAWLAPDMRAGRTSSAAFSGWPLCFSAPSEGSHQPPTSADLAAITWQKPARVAIHALRLLGPG